MNAVVQPFSPAPVLKTDDRDAALVLRCRGGDRHAFEELLRHYERPLFNAALRILNHREDARDVTQTAFLNAYQHLDRYDPKLRFFSWIYRIAVNETLNLVQARKRSEPLPDDLAEERPAPDAAAASAALDAGMQAALMALKLEYRTVLVLKHVQGLSYGVIALILDCEIKTVKSRLYTARQALREVLIGRGVLG
jgi:RNA polymerase sigma-70 factor (ECF subfamily)